MVLIGDELALLPFFMIGDFGELIGELGRKKLGLAGIGGRGGRRRESVGGGESSLTRGGSDGGLVELLMSVLLYKLC